MKFISTSWGIALIGLIAFGVLLYYAPQRPAPSASDAARAAATAPDTDSPEEPSTVIVINKDASAGSALVQDRLCGASSSCQNGEDGIAVAVLIGGTMPATTTTAVVQTDTDCNPDTYGISHCSNILKFADGSLIEVRHDHNMQAYPCLDPGETVTVEPQV